MKVNEIEIDCKRLTKEKDMLRKLREHSLIVSIIKLKYTNSINSKKFLEKIFRKNFVTIILINKLTV